MKRRLPRFGPACGAACLLIGARGFCADAGAGKMIFHERCAICHSAEPNDGGGAQGPSLIGIFGRPAASAMAFSYSDALRASHLTWDAATLDRFLASPTKVVPGTTMVAAVPQETDRANLIEYFQEISGLRAPSPNKVGEVPVASVESANWRLDAPGQIHRIEAAALPAPFATASSSNRSFTVRRPEKPALRLPPGFSIDTFVTGLDGPRRMLLAPNGDIFVTEIYGGRVTVLHPSPDGSRAAGHEVYASGLKQPFGLAFYPAVHPEWLYVAETHRVVRYRYQSGDAKARGEPQVVIPELPSGAGHFTRDIAFSADGKHLFVSVGSASNVAEAMSKKSPQEIRAWESSHGLGAAWDQETDRATVLVFDAAAPGLPVIHASGIRNCVGLTVQPANGSLWCTTNERDGLGDDLVPDYSTRVARGTFYGWPWYYIGSHEDPRLKGDRPDLAGKVAVPDVLYQSHSAAVGMTFYAANSGKSAFPTSYVGDAFVAFHGSWNRSLRTGYKLVRVRMMHGEPTGEYEDFLTGFIVDDRSVWGRPVATMQLADGSLLMSEDGNNVIYRISYAQP